MKLKTREDFIEYLSNIFDENKIVKKQLDNDVDITEADLWTDLLLHALEFVYHEGLMEKQIKVFLLFFDKLIEDTACKGISLQDAIGILRTRIQQPNFMSEIPLVSLKSCIDHICSSLLQHYNLITYVMCVPRDIEEHAQKEVVEVPVFNATTLKEAVPYEEWFTNKMLREAEDRYKEKEHEIDEFLMNSQKSLEEELVRCLNDIDIASNKIELKQAISKIVEKYAHLTEVEIETTLMKSKEQVFHVLEKSKIRPASSKSKMKRSARSPNKNRTSSVSPRKK